MWALIGHRLSKHFLSLWPVCCSSQLPRGHRFIEGFSPSFGFTGIAVAILGKNHPAGVLLTALLFGIMDMGSLRMSRVTSVSANMVTVVQSLVILLVAAPELIKWHKNRKRG